MIHSQLHSDHMDTLGLPAISSPIIIYFFRVDTSHCCYRKEHDDDLASKITEIDLVLVVALDDLPFVLCETSYGSYVSYLIVLRYLIDSHIFRVRHLHMVLHFLSEDQITKSIGDSVDFFNFLQK
jgi:hypothetical protein